MKLTNYISYALFAPILYSHTNQAHGTCGNYCYDKGLYLTCSCTNTCKTPNGYSLKKLCDTLSEAEEDSVKAAVDILTNKLDDASINATEKEFILDEFSKDFTNQSLEIFFKNSPHYCGQRDKVSASSTTQGGILLTTTAVGLGVIGNVAVNLRP